MQNLTVGPRRGEGSLAGPQADLELPAARVTGKLAVEEPGAARARSLERVDWAWAALLGALLAASPLTGSARLGPSLLLGALAGGAVLALRLRRRRRDVAPTRRAPLLAPPSAGQWALLVAVAAFFAPTLAWLWSEYTDSIWRNAHGLFVPLFMVLLGRSALRRADGRDEESSAWGFALLVPALALVVLDTGVASHYLATFGLLLALPALSLLLLGPRRTRALAMPIGLGIFLIPSLAFLEDPLGLPRATAAGIAPLLKAFSFPVLRHQTVFQLSSGVLVGVSGNCSGLSALHAGLALAVLLAVTSRSWPRRTLVLIAPVVITLVINTLRGFAIVVVSEHYGVGFINTPIHGLSGIFTVLVVLGGVWMLADRRGLREALA